MSVLQDWDLWELCAGVTGQSLPVARLSLCYLEVMNVEVNSETSVHIVLRVAWGWLLGWVSALLFMLILHSVEMPCFEDIQMIPAHLSPAIAKSLGISSREMRKTVFLPLLGLSWPAAYTPVISCLVLLKGISTTRKRERCLWFKKQRRRLLAWAGYLRLAALACSCAVSTPFVNLQCWASGRGKGPVQG